MDQQTNNVNLALSSSDVQSSVGSTVESAKQAISDASKHIIHLSN